MSPGLNGLWRREVRLELWPSQLEFCGADLDLFTEGGDKDGYTECRVGTDRLKFAACKDNLVVSLQVQM